MVENNEKQIKGPPASFHSKVWRHFGFYETVDGKALDKDYAISKNCFAKIKYNSNTTNLQMHLVRYHGELLSGDNEGKPSQPTIITAFKALGRRGHRHVSGNITAGRQMWFHKRMDKRGQSDIWCLPFLRLRRFDPPHADSAADPREPFPSHVANGFPPTRLAF
ncbi:hypothetical protein QQF64_017776 [Cirrhinus molitorella]|uniref:BED-type domain-containing protein n=1 Tax=Cirrhinus molitorella TaxID=172907 RepID=A0ABR3LNP0_9TELE